MNKMKIEYTAKSDELNALILAEYAARDAYNDLRLAYMSANSAYDASWRQRWGGTEEAHASLLDARKAADEALKVFNAARIARLMAAVSLDPRALL